MGATSAMIRHGVDVENILASWGFQERLGAAVGTIACASAANVFLTPVHFGAVIYGVKGFETAARQMLPHVTEAWQEDYQLHMAERTKIRSNGDGDDRSKSTEGEENSNEEETETEYMENRLVKTLGMILLIYSLSVSMYALRLMGKTVIKDKQEPEEHVQEVQEEE